MVKTAFKIANMECPSCAMRLEGLEDTLPGARRVSASYRKARLEIEYDEHLLSPQQIIAAIQALGYTATPE